MSYLNPPPEVLAEWSKLANPENPPTQGNDVLVMEIVLTVVSVLVVALRIYVRVFLTKSYGLDDTLILVNMIPLLGLAASIYLAISQYGWDRHVYDIPQELAGPSGKVAMCIQIFFTFSTTVTKISILLFYRRLTDRISTRFRYILYATMAIITCNALTALITYLVGCQPLSATFYQSDPTWRAANKGTFKCYNEQTFVMYLSVFNVVSDFVVCILPLSLFLNLQMHWRKKVELAAIFSAGFFLCVCGILRMIKLVKAFYYEYDFPWEAMPIWLWTGIEAHMAVVIASLPSLNYLIRRVWREASISDRFKSNSQQRYASRYGRGYGQTKLSTVGDSSNTSDKQVIHVTQEVQLEEYSREDDFESNAGQGIDGKAMRKDRRAWLDESTSDDDSIQLHAPR